MLIPIPVIAKNKVCGTKKKHENHRDEKFVFTEMGSDAEKVQ